MKKAISTYVKEGLPPETEGYIYNRRKRLYFRELGNGLVKDRNKAHIYTFRAVLGYLSSHNEGMMFDTI